MRACNGALSHHRHCMWGKSSTRVQAGKADVLVATAVASKGLDFPAIQHVINFDMPSEIENYVHRIGRTGRCGKTGIATTFINKNQSESILLDLKHLLKEAKQRIPPVLMVSLCLCLSSLCHCPPRAYNICLAPWGSSGWEGCSTTLYFRKIEGHDEVSFKMLTC